MQFFRLFLLAWLVTAFGAVAIADPPTQVEINIPSATAPGYALVTGTNPLPIVGTITPVGVLSVLTSPGLRTIVALDIATVTSGGTAVTALNAGHRTAGGFLYNPIGASINLCINEQATASGTTSAGALTCIQPGQAYTLTPASGAVSVITSDSAHAFSGQGLN